jgi:hypothetical protein
MTAPREVNLYHAAGLAPRSLDIARPLRILSGGNHHPILCEMGDASGSAGWWVVKPSIVMSRATDRGTFGVLAELAGAEVCAWAGLRAPAVGLTRFPASLDEAMLHEDLAARGRDEREEILEIFRVNRGKLAFCVRFLHGAVDLRPAHLGDSFSPTSVADAAALVLTDAYLRHDDRRIENPNAIWHEGRLVAIDHGSAFAGVTRPGSTGDDLARHTVLHSQSFRAHVALAAARGADESTWETFVARLEGVNLPTVTALATSWPAELDDDPQSGQRGLRSRLARFLGERGLHVRALREALREICAREP